MNTFLTGREGGTEPDKETLEERQSEEVGSCGCEGGCSRCAAVSRMRACTAVVFGASFRGASLYSPREIPPLLLVELEWYAGEYAPEQISCAARNVLNVTLTAAEILICKSPPRNMKHLLRFLPFSVCACMHACARVRAFPSPVTRSKHIWPDTF